MNETKDQEEEEDDDDEWEQVGPKNKSSVTRGVSISALFPMCGGGGGGKKQKAEVRSRGVGRG